MGAEENFLQCKFWFSVCGLGAVCGFVWCVGRCLMMFLRDVQCC